MGPITGETDFVTVSEPVGDLLDGGLLQVWRERGLACTRSVTGQNIPAGVCDPADAECGIQNAEW